MSPHKLKRGTSCPRFILLGVIAAVLVLVPLRSWRTAAAQSPAPQSPPAPFRLPSGEGAQLIEANCKRCHTLKRIVSTRRTKNEWKTVMRRMATYAVLKESENKIIVNYLAVHYGPTKRKRSATSPPKPVSSSAPQSPANASSNPWKAQN